MAVTQAEYLAQIAREKAANDRAVLEGYESAAHKEAHANVKPGVAGIVGGAAEKERLANIEAAKVTDPRTGKPFGSASDMEAYANSLSAQVFNPVTGANFTSAVDYEIDANRRARKAGYLNAADYESGLRTRVDPIEFPFQDPRLQPAPVIPEKFRLGTANDIEWNPDQPLHPDYDPNWRNDPKYAGGFDVHGNPITGGDTIKGGGLLGNMYEAAYQPRGLLDWGQYQTDPNFVLQQNNLANYQTWAKGIGDAGALPVYSAGTGTSNYVNNTGSSGAYTSVMGDTKNNQGVGNTTMDAQGNKWIMNNGQWIRADSDLGSILSSGGDMIYPFDQYDSSGAYSGAEGFTGPTVVGGPNVAGTAYGYNPAWSPGDTANIGWGPTATRGILGTAGPLGNAGFDPTLDQTAADQ